MYFSYYSFIKWSPVQLLFAFIGADDNFHLFNAETRTEIQTEVKFYNYNYNQVNFSSDGKFLAGWDDSKSVYLIETSTGNLLHQIKLDYFVKKILWSKSRDKLFIQSEYTKRLKVETLPDSIFGATGSNH